MIATMTLTDSSCLAGFHYDFNAQVLEIELTQHRRYAYQVDPTLFAHFLLAESKGQFYERRQNTHDFSRGCSAGCWVEGGEKK